MIQFYLLSVLLNIAGGIALAADETRRSGGILDDARRVIRDPTLRLVLGILSLVTGAFKLLSVIRGDIPVVGDFLPAMAGFAVGSGILLELGRSATVHEKGGEGFERPDARARTPVWASARRISLLRDSIEQFLLERKAAVGIAGVIAGLVHFLFPTMPIL